MTNKINVPFYGEWGDEPLFKKHDEPFLSSSEFNIIKQKHLETGTSFDLGFEGAIARDFARNVDATIDLANEGANMVKDFILDRREKKLKKDDEQYLPSGIEQISSTITNPKFERPWTDTITKTLSDGFCTVGAFMGNKQETVPQVLQGMFEANPDRTIAAEGSRLIELSMSTDDSEISMFKNTKALSQMSPAFLGTFATGVRLGPEHELFKRRKEQLQYSATDMEALSNVFNDIPCTEKNTTLVAKELLSIEHQPGIADIVAESTKTPDIIRRGLDYFVRGAYQSPAERQAKDDVRNFQIGAKSHVDYITGIVTGVAQNLISNPSSIAGGVATVGTMYALGSGKLTPKTTSHAAAFFDIGASALATFGGDAWAGSAGLLKLGANNIREVQRTEHQQQQMVLQYAQAGMQTGINFLAGSKGKISTGDKELDQQIIDKQNKAIAERENAKIKNDIAASLSARYGATRGAPPLNQTQFVPVQPSDRGNVVTSAHLKKARGKRKSGGKKLPADTRRKKKPRTK